MLGLIELLVRAIIIVVLGGLLWGYLISIVGLDFSIRNLLGESKFVKGFALIVQIIAGAVGILMLGVIPYIFEGVWGTNISFVKLFGSIHIHPIMISFFVCLMSAVFGVYKSFRHKEENEHWWVLPLILNVVCFGMFLFLCVAYALEAILLGVTGGNEGAAAVIFLFLSVAFLIFVIKNTFGRGNGQSNSTQDSDTQQSSGYSGAGGAGFYKPYTEAPFIEKYANKNIYEGELYDSYSFRQATGRIGKYGGVYDTTKGYDRTAGSFDERGNVDSMDRTDLGDSTFVKKVANGDIGNIDSFGNIYDKYDHNRKIGSIDENGYIYEGDGLTRKQVGRID